MSYPDSVRYLYALGNELKAGAKFGLERMQILLEQLGNPERGQRFVHVAGTNGKGSTCAMIASVLAQASLQTGLYTSPHLVEPTERIQRNGLQVSAEEFAALFDKVHTAAEALLEQNRIDAHPSYFEMVTAMALLYFRQCCDVSVIEVGLGGRLDATNVITPELCVITPVAFDHEAFLGNTLSAIAAEKAGILKPGVPAVIAAQNEQAAQIIKERAEQLGCELFYADERLVSKLTVSKDGCEFTLNGDLYRCPLRGRHQLQNAITAILACKRLAIPVSTIQAGIANVRWPGRLELALHNPDFLLDGAHNPAGANALANYIREFCQDGPVWIVYGAMRDKAIEEVTGQLFPLADHLIVTAPDFPRALRPEAILQVTAHANASIAPTLPEAVEMARTAPRNATIFFTGSLFLVGEAKRLLEKRCVS